jgi:hypothetical protein
MFLKERRATRLTYDESLDRTTLSLVEAEDTVPPRRETATLLLDAQGFLVGVDVSPSTPSRVTVMLGPHEAVERTVEVRVTTRRTADDEIVDVSIDDAGRTVRARERNPHFGAA